MPTSLFAVTRSILASSATLLASVVSLTGCGASALVSGSGTYTTAPPTGQPAAPTETTGLLCTRQREHQPMAFRLGGACLLRWNHPYVGHIYFQSRGETCDLPTPAGPLRIRVEEATMTPEWTTRARNVDVVVGGYTLETPRHYVTYRFAGNHFTHDGDDSTQCDQILDR